MNSFKLYSDRFNCTNCNRPLWPLVTLPSGPGVLIALIASRVDLGQGPALIAYQGRIFGIHGNFYLRQMVGIVERFTRLKTRLGKLSLSLFFWVPTGPSLVRWSHLCDTLVQMLNVLKQCRGELDDLPDEVKGDLADAVARLEMGHALSMPLSRPMPSIGRGVHELRLRDSSGIYRVIYYLAGSNAIHLLHAFMKKKSQTPQQNIEIAKKRLREVTK
jgi:phage-related protein